MGKSKKTPVLIIVISILCTGLITFAVFLIKSILYWNDLKEKYGPLTDALAEKGIDKIYSTADIHEQVEKLTKGGINIITVASPYDLTPVSGEVSSENITAGEPFYIIFGNDTLLEYRDSLCKHFATEEFSAEDFALYSYENIDYMQDEDLIFDLMELEDKSYDGYFISMFDVKGFEPGDFSAFTGIEPYVFKKSFDTEKASEYLNLYESLIFKEDDEVKDDTKNAGNKEDEKEAGEDEKKAGPAVIYAGIDPMMIEKLSGDLDLETYVGKKKESIIDAHKDTVFNIILPYYYIGHYASYSEPDISDMRNKYNKFVSLLSDSENVKIHFMNETEWICSNKCLFNEGSDISVKPENSKRIAANILTEAHVTAPEDFADRFSDFETTVLELDMSLQETADLSDTCVVIFGDSIFDLVRDDSSIQNVFSGYSGASVLNYSIGGVPAARIITDGYPEIMGGELKDIETIKKDISAEMTEKKRLIFILEFGINDYLRSTPISNPEDYYDADTFEGALARAIDTEILYEWPDAEILIMGPGLVGLNDFGRIPYIEGGHTLQEYRNCSADLAEQRGFKYMDLSEYLGFTEEDFDSYFYADMIHYNELGRLTAGFKLIEFIDNNF